MPATTFSNEIAILRQNYIEQLPKQIEILKNTKSALTQNSLPSTEIQTLYRLSHNFSGSGATFGFPGISTAARDLYNNTNDFLVGKQSNANSQLAILDSVRNLITAMLAVEKTKTPLTPSASPSPKPTAEIELPILIKRSSKSIMDDLARQLEHFGYPIKLIDTISDKTPPAQAIIAHVETDKNLDVIKNWGQFASLAQAPLLLISGRDDFTSRLAAVQAGAQGYFTTPVDTLKIIDRIEQLHPAQTTQSSWNILIIDDDAMLAEFYSHTLQAEKMSITISSDPTQVLDTLASQSFDLILIDYLMPACGGQELARIIRQQERYLSLPIIFMSSDEDVEARLIDQELGIDDFLIKPFTPAQLVSVVKSRARRAAELRTLMTHDSFTGLLNHAAFNERLSLEIAVYTRTKIDAVCALLDIDHFKRINDTYGHATGDKVIKSLARLMQQQLRRTDIIGRCGGEEFGIIMPGCSIADATRIMEELRAKFAAMEFTTPDGTIIRASFSGGLSPFIADINIDQMIHAVDTLLYTAKKNGRNNIAADQ